MNKIEETLQDKAKKHHEFVAELLGMENLYVYMCKNCGYSHTDDGCEHCNYIPK